MYTRIQHYRLKDPEEATRRVRESYLPLLRQIPGFSGYYVVRGEGGAYASITVFETREGVEEAHRLSRQWNAEHAQDLIESTDETLIGDTVVAEMPEREHEERRAA